MVSWSATATTLFGMAAEETVGRDVCDVLLTGPGQREHVRYALDRIAAGQVWSATVAGGSLGDGRFAILWEPTTGGTGDALVIVQRAWPQPAPSWLGEAATVIGTTLDISRTAEEAATVAVAGFADAVAIYGAERLLAADEFTSPQGSREVVVRRLAARLRGKSEADTERLLRPGEVLVFGADTPSSKAMATGEPVLFDEPDGESAARLRRHPDGEEVISGYCFFLAVPLIARDAVVGCAVFARTPASPAFSPGDVVLGQELAARAAVCIDNARLYDRERRTALALQRGLLPGRPRCRR